MGQFLSYRELLIFKNEATNKLAEQQLDLLNRSSAGVKERALKITIADKESPLYKKYKVDDRFTVILAGKDGYEKYRTNKLLEMNTLFSIIDAMPMRRREMKKN